MYWALDSEILLKIHSISYDKNSLNLYYINQELVKAWLHSRYIYLISINYYTDVNSIPVSQNSYTFIGYPFVSKQVFDFISKSFYIVIYLIYMKLYVMDMKYNKTNTSELPIQLKNQSFTNTVTLTPYPSPSLSSYLPP